jgi:arsenate reductase (thioredoxin)
MTPHMTLHVLFVCVHNSARSQMAEAFLNRIPGFSAASAGIEPGKLNQIVVRAMQERGIDISGNHAKSVPDVLTTGRRFDHVVTVCDGASAERCPVIPGIRTRHHLGFPDPSLLTGSPDEQLAAVRRIRDDIEQGVTAWAMGLESQHTASA